MRFKWLPHFKKHCSKHNKESPEICPDFIERLMVDGHPSKIYADKTYDYRNVFEGFLPRDTGRPYRVIFEVSDENEIVPVACWRIKDKEYRKSR